MLHFRTSEQGPIKLMQQLLSSIIDSVAVEKDLLKELRQMSEKLMIIDKSPEEKLPSDQANLILGKCFCLYILMVNFATEIVGYGDYFVL